MLHTAQLRRQNDNGISGRKRSRSHGRSSATRRMPADAQSSLTKATQRALLDLFLDRDQLFKASIVSAGTWQTDLLKKNNTQFRSFLDISDVGRGPRRDVKSFTSPGQTIHNPAMLANKAHPLTIRLPEPKKSCFSQETKDLSTRKKETALQFGQIDELVPIRLDVEWDQLRLRDTFTWNLHDRTIDVDSFARQMAEDFGISLSSPQLETLVRRVGSSMSEQITDFHPHIFIEEDALDPHLPYSAYKNDEMRILVKLNITIGQYTLVDQFEWDINNPLNSPEEFANQMTRELSLSGEFTTAIAHSIREQSQLYTQSLYVVGHPFDGRPVEDHELLASFQPSPLPSAFRPYQAAKDFTPVLYELNDAELEKTELSLSREERRQKRSVNRRGGPALPDLKDRRRTIRTLLVSSVLPGAASSVHESRIYKRPLGTGKFRKDKTRDGFEDFDDSESEESAIDSPAAAAVQHTGTARTRGVRGAASAAQAAMRHTLGRSATPESNILHHHETRASGRRMNREESTPELQGGLVITLHLNPIKLRHLRDKYAKGRNVTPTETGASTRHAISGASHGVHIAMGPATAIANGHLRNTAYPAPAFQPLVRPTGPTSARGPHYAGTAGSTNSPGQNSAFMQSSTDAGGNVPR